MWTSPDNTMGFGAAFPTGPDIRMYHRLKFGTLMDMSVLDSVSSGATGPAEAVSSLAARPARTSKLLGFSETSLAPQLGHGPIDAVRRLLIRKLIVVFHGFLQPEKLGLQRSCDGLLSRFAI